MILIAITNCSPAPLRTKDEKLSLPLKGNDLGQTVEDRDAITLLHKAVEATILDLDYKMMT